MFEFLRKRSTETSDPQAEMLAAEQSAAAALSAARRDEQSERARSLNGDEQAAVALILSSEFAGVRLAAAEHVHAQALLEQVLQAMRNTDRRVAKLMQGRLDAIRYLQAERHKAQLCLDAAARLMHDDKLTPNQVAELDRQWKVTAAAPEQAQEFDLARAALAARLETQVSLQRRIIDALAEVRKLPTAALAPEAAQAVLVRCAAAQAEFAAAPEHAALPRHLLGDYAQAVEAARAALAAPPAPVPAEPAGDRAAPAAVPAAASEVVLPKEVAKPVRAPQPPKAVDKQFLDTLDAMEAALEHGLLHAAADHDKWLKEHKSGRLTPAQADRLNHLRAELKRLGDWARWGGNVSREELVKTVEELPSLGLAMAELAKKVGSMRERWKALDGVSGHAPKGLWERFDAACSKAYAPAAAHFKQLADERHNNAVKAQALIDETLAMGAAGASGVEWKNIAAAGQRLRQMWGRLGTIDRKDKRRLDQAFDKALAQLLAPLSEQRKLETAQREQLIAEAQNLNPADRHTLDQLKRLQERWQEHAKALPLERKAEQALWQRFRAACDAIFSKRKEVAHAADHERKAHLHAREALCAGLEAATFSGDDKAQLAAIAKTLRDAAAAWQGAGIVPRASEAKITQRYQSAVAAVQGQADAIKRRAGAAQANALRDKLRLCQALETELATDPDAAGAAPAPWAERWAALPALAADYERTLHGRFSSALQAWQAGGAKRAAYAALLERNSQPLRDEVLRLEIVAGVDSGAEFARDRLKMQVEVLQSSLKSGQKPLTPAAQYVQLCAMPALADARTTSRIEQLFRRIGAAGGV